MQQWWESAVFYSIYPLGFCDAPPANDFSSPPEPRLQAVIDHLPYMADLGFNALYLGPLFESSAHGYDTADYYHVDRRLGSDETLIRLVDASHQAGIRVILDGVFNHVGRDFWAFRDLRENRQGSRYREWFRGVDFSSDNPNHDGFTYEAWEGHYDLVTLNHDNPEVRRHLLDAAGWMMDTLNIDGLRLDVAYLIDPDFLRELASFCRSRRKDFLLLGEMIHGDYGQIAGPQMLDSATNYECYKGIHSSHNDRNYFEIAWSLRRQFGPEGLYRELPLFNFVDNHDVDRVASVLKNANHLPLVYVLLFTMPGIPSVYYGSELAWQGVKHDGDAALRPAWNPAHADPRGGDAPGAHLRDLIRRLSGLRASYEPLRCGSYRELFVSNEQLCFARTTGSDTVVVALNASEEPAAITAGVEHDLHDLLGPGGHVAAGQELELPGYGFRVLAGST